MRTAIDGFFRINKIAETLNFAQEKKNTSKKYAKPKIISLVAKHD